MHAQWKQPETFDSTLGVDVIGGYVTAVLYGIFCVQTHIFFHRAHGESKLLKASVWALWLLNTIHLVLIIHFNYWYMVTNFGNRNVLSDHRPWSIPVFFSITPTTNLLVKLWFIYRVWILSARNIALTFTMGLGLIVSWGFGVAFSVELYILPTFSSYEMDNWMFFVQFAVEAFSDLAVAIALAFFLMRGRNSSMSRTSSIINTLLVYTVNTGFLTALLCVASVIGRILEPNNFYFFATYMILSSLYSNALLGSLNARDWLRTMDAPSVVSIPLGRASVSSSGGSSGSGRPHPPPRILYLKPQPIVVHPQIIEITRQQPATLMKPATLSKASMNPGRRASQLEIQVDTEVIKAEL